MRLSWFFPCLRKHHHHRHRHKAISISFIILLKEPNMAKFSLVDTMQVSFTAKFLDSAGNLTAVSNVEVSVDNPSLLTLTFDKPTEPVSSVTASVSAVGPVGPVVVTVSGTNLDGSVVTGTQEIDVIGDNAVSVVFEMGTPTPKA